jgi:hypothetical protein
LCRVCPIAQLTEWDRQWKQTPGERVWRLLLYYYFEDFDTKRRTKKLQSLKIVPKDIISHPSTIGNPPYIKIRRR